MIEVKGFRQPYRKSLTKRTKAINERYNLSKKHVVIISEDTPKTSSSLSNYYRVVPIVKTKIIK